LHNAESIVHQLSRFAKSRSNKRVCCHSCCAWSSPDGSARRLLCRARPQTEAQTGPVLGSRQESGGRIRDRSSRGWIAAGARLVQSLVDPPTGASSQMSALPSSDGSARKLLCRTLPHTETQTGPVLESHPGSGFRTRPRSFRRRIVASTGLAQSLVDPSVTPAMAPHRFKMVPTGSHVSRPTWQGLVSSHSTLSGPTHHLARSRRYATIALRARKGSPATC
jgi:hypothetical protein